MPAPASSRLAVDERRRQLIELGEQLFTTHTYAELSMSHIAAEAGISKALLYHYFPSKQEFFRATLAAAVEELQERTRPDPGAPPAQALAASLDAYLAWIEERRVAYAKLVRTMQTVEAVRELVDGVREATAARVLAGVSPRGTAPTPAMRAAVRGWLWFMDGVCLDWIEQDDGLDRADIHTLLVGTLAGALLAAGAETQAAALRPG